MSRRSRLRAASSSPSTLGSEMTSYTTMAGARRKRAPRGRAVAVIAIALAAGAAACNDTAEPGLNNPRLAGVQGNPSHVTVTLMVRRLHEGNSLHFNFPRALCVSGRYIYNLPSAEPRH